MSYDEALVLSYGLDRWQRGDTLDPEGTTVIDDLTATFEPLVDEAFDANYGQVIEQPRCVCGLFLSGQWGRWAFVGCTDAAVAETSQFVKTTPS